MCTPTAWAYVATAVITAYSAKQTADIQTDYQSAVATEKAKAAEFSAKDAQDRGELAVKQSRLRTKKLKGEQTAGIAASGFSIDPGSSAAGVLEDTEAFGTEDVFAIRSNAAREAWALREQGKGFIHEGALRGVEAQNKARKSSLEAASSVASKWYSYKKAA